MGTLLILAVAYAAFGIWLVSLSVRLARSVPSLFRRAAIHSAIFSVWFSPGLIGGNGGALPVPLWLALVANKPVYALWVSGVTFVVVWAISCVVAVGAAGIRHRFRRDEPGRDKQTPMQM